MNDNILLALQLLLAHVLTDFVFQSQKQINQKRLKKGKSVFLYFHSVLAGLLTYVILQQWQLWYIAVIISVTHLLIDLWKLHQVDDNLKNFLIDQLLHLLVLGLIWLLLTENTSKIFPLLLDFLSSKIILTYLVGYLIIIFPIGFIIGKATRSWQKEIAEENEITSLKKAGRFIGIFERILVLTFILSNNFSAIGFLIGAKSILRFGDKDKNNTRKQTEYVLIGTLMSFSLTIIIGVLMRQLIFQ